MPIQKKRKSKAKITNEQKHITKRLMKISILVDKYIYKHVPISLLQAESYLQEIISFKKMCYQDARSLQVIEKLTNYMKAIIEETESKDGCMENTSAAAQTEANISCLVYSIADADKTYAYEEIMGEDIINNEKQNFSGKEVRHTDATALIQINNSKLDRTASQLSNIDNELTASVVGLSINGTGYENGQLLSQNMIDTSHIEEQTYDCDTCAQDMAEVDKEIDNILQPHYETITKHRIKEKQEIPNHICIEPVNDSTTVYISQHNKEVSLCSQSILKNFTETNFNNDTIYSNKLISDNVENDPIILTRNDISKTNSNNTIPYDARRNESISSLNTPKDYLTQSKNLTVIKTGKDSIVTNECSNTEVKNTNISLTNTCPKRIIENKGRKGRTKKPYKGDDLSWVENIKYVREIHVDEYDPKLSASTFWDNCFLPENWEDRDFE